MNSKKILAMAALAALALALVLALASCGKNASSQNANPSSTAGEAASPSDADGGERSAKKINAYTKGYNDLVGMFYGSTNGLDNLLEEYKSQKISSMKSANADTRLTVYLNTSMLRNSLESLKEGLAQGGSAQTAKIDGVVKTMVANGDELFRQATSLEGYIKSKKYLEDDLAEAKALDAEFIRRWERLNTDFYALGNELDRIERANRSTVIAGLRGNGDIVGMNIQEGTYAANDLLALFEQASDFKDAGKLAKADTLAKQIEKNSNETKAQLDAKPDSQSHSSDMSAYEDLTAFIGSYRQIRAGGDTNEFDEMVRHYNQLVNRRR